MRDPVIPDCLCEGCTNYASWGYQPSPGVPARWTCFEHRHLLVRQAPPSSPPSSPQVKPAPIGDLFTQKD